jgi:hypothetical protein
LEYNRHFRHGKSPVQEWPEKDPVHSCIAMHINDITGDQAIIIKPNFVIALKTVALAGDFLVVVAKENHFYRPAGMMRQQGRPGSNMVSLGFLSSEPTAHAFHLAYHFVGLQAQNFCNYQLGFCWILRRSMYGHFTVLTGNANCSLGFEVPVFLCAGFQASLQNML